MTGRLIVKNGIYYAVINYKDQNGRYKQKYLSTGLIERGNKRNAQIFLNQQLESFRPDMEPKNDTQEPKKDNDIIFISYVEDYVNNKKKELSPVVYETYKTAVKIMKGYFGNKLKLKDVTYKHIEDYYEYLRIKRKNKNSSIKHHAIILSPTLRLAYRDDLIAKNPYDFTKKIKREKPIRTYYNKDELDDLFKYTDNTPIGLIVRVAAYYGFRRSEILGLKWQAIDLVNKTISIQHKVLCVDKVVYCSDTLKTTASNRTLPLLPEIETLLIKRQNEIEHNKDLYGRCYNQKYLDYVFVSDIGDLILPDFVTHKFNDILTKNKLKHIRFHDLRHSCASLLVASGVPMKNIQEWLGHANFNTTADVYSHLDFSAKVQSANIISSALTNNSEDIDEEILELERLLAEKKKLQQAKKKKKDFEM